jgi:hypothetical protein
MEPFDWQGLGQVAVYEQKQRESETEMVAIIPSRHHPLLNQYSSFPGCHAAHASRGGGRLGQFKADSLPPPIYCIFSLIKAMSKVSKPGVVV